MSRFLLALTVAIASAAAARASADPLQDRVVAGARATPRDLYRFRRTLALERSGSPRKVAVEQFDPRLADADRWSLLGIDGHAPSAKDLDGWRKAKRGKTPSYAELAEWFGAPATRSEAGPGRVTYRFARLPAGTLKIGSHDASADTRAEALVDTKGREPFVERIRFTLGKGFSMMLVASVRTMVIDARYRQLPDGHVVPLDTASDITGSMMGKSGRMRSRATFSDIQPVR